MTSKSFNDVIGSDDIVSELVTEFRLSKSAADDVALLVESFESIIDSEELSDEEAVAAAEISASEFAQITKGRNAAPLAAKTWDKVRARRKPRRGKFVVPAPPAPELKVPDDFTAAVKPSADPRKGPKMTKITKKFVLGQLELLANLQKRNNETPQQAFARFMETAEGAAGYRAYKSLPDDEPSAIEASVPASRDTELPAFKAIAKRAAALRAADPKAYPTDAQAFSKVYEAPESAALREAYKRERATIAA